MERKAVVLDLSSHNTVTSFAEIKAAGIQGVVLKATQGTRFVDRTFKERLAKAREAGLLVASYHFATDSDVHDQVAHFLETVGDTSDVMLALDYEPNPTGGTMSFAQAKQFLQLVYERTGQRPVLYSGHLLKEQMPKGGDPFVASHRLWLAHYAAQPSLPRGFDKCWLWQFSDRAISPGIRNDNTVDVNAFGGSDLAAEWIDTPGSGTITVASALADAPRSIVIPAADPPSPEPAAATGGITGTITGWLDTSDRNYNIVKRIADQGSRIGGTLTRGTSWFWRLLIGGTGGTVAVNKLADTSDKGAAGLFFGWVERHPFMFVGICLSITAALVYFFVLRPAIKFLVTAYRDGRYDPVKRGTT
jgi:GH25 family lysozyme M1 (1,4-beta-N-acetylmuramidase)